MLAGTEERTRELAGAEVTFTPVEVAERVPSVTVKVLRPTDFKTIAYDPVPLAMEGEEGRLAWESLEENVSVLEYPVAVLLFESFAVTAI
jgi:hypothetical protein